MTTRLLTGPTAGDLLTAAVRADGAELVSWTVDRVHARPGAEVSVGYTVDVRRGTASGSDYLVATTADLDPELLTRPGTVRLDGPDGTVHLWRHPLDPALTGLAVACDPAALTAAWRRVDPTAPVVQAVQFVGYRPLRRAVLRAETSDGTHYLKVVRPSRAAGLRARHDLFTGRPVPAPRVLAEPVPGLLVLEALTAPSLVTILAGGPTDRVPRAAQLLVTLDALPEARHLPARPSWSARAGEYGPAVTAAWGLDAREVVDGVVSGLAATEAGPVVTTHGDPHGANLLMGPDRRIGALLDVDTLGPGHRVDDLACFVAHLVALPTLDPVRYGWTGALVSAYLTAFDDAVDPRALRVRVAGVLVSLVPGAPDADVAATWLGAARVWLALADLSHPGPTPLVLAPPPDPTRGPAPAVPTPTPPDPTPTLAAPGPTH